MALNYTAGWSFVGEGSFYIHGDYLWHNFDLLKVKEGSPAFYYGPEIYLHMRAQSAMDARFPVGLDYFFESAAIDIFMEVVPILQLAPAAIPGLNGGIGIRFNFCTSEANMLEGKKDFLDTEDFSRDTLVHLIKLAVKMRKNKEKYCKALKNKKLAMIFEKSSTRTRVSFEAGIYELGGMGIFLSSRDIQIGRGEPIKDTAKVLSRYVDAIMIRTFKQEDVKSLAENASVPVINGLTDLLHPCQAMADFQTILEHKGRLEGLKLCFIGDGNNVANSLGF